MYMCLLTSSMDIGQGRAHGRSWWEQGEKLQKETIMRDNLSVIAKIFEKGMRTTMDLNCRRVG